MNPNGSDFTSPWAVSEDLEAFFHQTARSFRQPELLFLTSVSVWYVTVFDSVCVSICVSVCVSMCVSVCVSVCCTKLFENFHKKINATSTLAWVSLVEISKCKQTPF